MDPKQMIEMAKKAQSASNLMKKVEVVGKSKSELTAVLLNGVNELDIKFKEELLEKKLSTKLLEEEVKQAYQNASKALQKELASGQNMDAVKEMFGL